MKKVHYIFAVLARLALTVFLAITPSVYASLLAIGSPADRYLDERNVTTGERVNQYFGPFVQSVYGVDYGADGSLYFTTSFDNIVKVDSATGSIVDPLFVFRDDANQFRDSEDLAVGPDGHIYVSSGRTNSVWKFDGTTGDVIDSGFANLPGDPTGLTFGPDGHLYVSDRNFNTVSRFDGSTGALLEVVAGNPSPGGQIEPLGLEFGPDGHLYFSSVSDIYQLDLATGLLSLFIDDYQYQPGQLMSAYDIAFGPDGLLYVADSRFGNILRFDAVDGSYVDTFVSCCTSTTPEFSYLAFSPLVANVSEPAPLSLLALGIAAIGFSRVRAAQSSIRGRAKLERKRGLLHSVPLIGS